MSEVVSFAKDLFFYLLSFSFLLDVVPFVLLMLLAGLRDGNIDKDFKLSNFIWPMYWLGGFIDSYYYLFDGWWVSKYKEYESEFWFDGWVDKNENKMRFMRLRGSRANDNNNNNMELWKNLHYFQPIKRDILSRLSISYIYNGVKVKLIACGGRRVYENFIHLQVANWSVEGIIPKATLLI